jgi:hypothetical protein
MLSVPLSPPRPFFEPSKPGEAAAVTPQAVNAVHRFYPLPAASLQSSTVERNMRKIERNTMVRLADYVEPAKAAEIIGCTDGRVYQKLRAGEFSDVIPIGKNRFLIARRECEKMAKNPAPTGRPRKAFSR